MKRILLLLAITLTILTLASCGGEDIELPNNESQQSEQDASDDAVSECEHEYEEKVLVAATCVKNGITKKTCKLCKKSENVTVSKTAHVEVTDKGTAATCTTPGTTDGKHCSVCDTVTVAQAPIAALGHTEVTDPAVPATCTTPGKTEGKHCSVCNTVTVAQAPIAALGHTEVTDPAVPATCTTPGKTEGKHCSVCNTVTVAQAPTEIGGHTTIMRTQTPVTCRANGSVEIYCTKCETVQSYETILKGHYSADHEYASVTHPSIGNLCIGFKPDDRCEVCDARFIAPGTYTALSFGNWRGTVQFKFDYYNNLGSKQSASKITISSNDSEVKFDDYLAYGYDDNFGAYKRNYDGIIVITEEDFAIVDQAFYNVFQQYFEPGEYTLSGKYEFDVEYFMFGAPLLNAPYGTYNIRFKYLGSDRTVYYSDYIQILETSNGPQMNYSNRGNIAYYSWNDDWGAWDDNFLEYVIFEQPQSVSKEFFEWFTYYANKVII